jgi:hypothetical protein
MTTITSIIKDIDTISPNIKNKYVSLDELQLLQDKMETFLEIITTSKNSILRDKHYGLDVIFPAMDHLKLFLDVEDLGAIALVSKTLYDLMVKQFTHFNIDVYILNHYISNKIYDYDVNINFIVQGQPISVPINIDLISHRKLRMLIGHKKYILLKGGYKALSKDDFIYVFNKNKEIRTYNTVICIFCEKLNLYHDEHTHCALEYHNNSPIKYTNFENITTFGRYLIKTNPICPELEFIALQNLKKNIPIKMKSTCKGVYTDGDIDRCLKCGIKKHIHLLYTQKK